MDFCKVSRVEGSEFCRDFAKENPGFFPQLGANVYPFAERHFPGGIAPLLRVMLAAVFGGDRRW